MRLPLHLGFLVLAFFLSFSSLSPRQAAAQGGVVGSIMGDAYDQTGRPLPGVKIKATSPTQIGGAKITYTNADGQFRIPGLQPGTFEVEASAKGMQSVVQKGIAVGVNAPAEISLVLEVAVAKVEEVKVVEKAPIVSTTTANVKEVYDEEFVDQLPTEWRTAVENTVGNNTPGAVNSGVRTTRIRGGGNNQNAFLVEGFYMNGQKVTMKSLAAMEVQTAGYGAEYASVAGGVVNMVTKSGSNKFEFDINGFHEDRKNLTFFKDEVDTQAPGWFSVINPSFSGPIVKDRLWYFVNIEARSEVYGADRDPELTLGEPPRQSIWNFRVGTKLTWQVTPRNKIQTFTNTNINGYKNWADRTQYERDAQQMRDLRDYFVGVTWESLLGENVFFKSQVGWQLFWNEDAPENCRTDPVGCNHIVRVRQTFPRTVNSQSWDSRNQTKNQSLEFINTLEWFANSKALGEHNIKATNRVYTQYYQEFQSTPGDRYVEWNGAIPRKERTYYANDPRLEDARYGYRITGSRGTRTVTSLQDVFRPTRFLTITPGGAVTTISAQTLGGQAVDIQKAALTPHLSVAWDATHDGRTVLRGSFNQYVDADAIRIARFANGDRVYRDCNYSASSGQFDSGCVYSGGASGRTFGTPCGPSGFNVDGSPCREKLKIPRTWEYTAGAEREIIQGVGLGADVVYRQYNNPYERRETNRIWNPGGTELDQTGQYRNGRNQTIDDLGTPAAAKRRYLGVTAAVHKREGKLKLSSAYTWSRLQGNVLDGEDNQWGNIPGRDLFLYGYLNDDARHVIRNSFTYQWTKWFTTGVTHSYSSGRPYQRRFRNVVTNGYEDYRATVGIDPRTNINDPADDRALRLPDVQRFNLQARVNFRQLTGVNAELYADFLNILALRTTTSVEENDGPRWGQQRGRMDPMKVRLGFRYKY